MNELEQTRTNSNEQTQTNKLERTNSNEQTRTDKLKQTNSNGPTQTNQLERTNSNGQTRYLISDFKPPKVCQSATHVEINPQKSLTSTQLYTFIGSQSQKSNC